MFTLSSLSCKLESVGSGHANLPYDNRKNGETQAKGLKAALQAFLFGSSRLLSSHTPSSYIFIQS